MDTKKNIKLGVLMVYLGSGGMVYFIDHCNIFLNAIFFMIAIFGGFLINENLELLRKDKEWREKIEKVIEVNLSGKPWQEQDVLLRDVKEQLLK